MTQDELEQLTAAAIAELERQLVIHPLQLYIDAKNPPSTSIIGDLDLPDLVRSIVKAMRKANHKRRKK